MAEIDNFVPILQRLRGICHYCKGARWPCKVVDDVNLLF